MNAVGVPKGVYNVVHGFEGELDELFDGVDRKRLLPADRALLRVAGAEVLRALRVDEPGAPLEIAGVERRGPGGVLAHDHRLLLGVRPQPVGERFQVMRVVPGVTFHALR